MGIATKTIQDKLKHLQNESWKKNEIAEKIKSTKQEELEMLHNRWKDGAASDCKEDKVQVGFLYLEKRYYVFHPITRFVCLSVSVCVSVCLALSSSKFQPQRKPYLHISALFLAHIGAFLQMS